MADKANTTDLLPKIVVTEPTPSAIDNAGFVQNVLPKSYAVEVVVPSTPVPKPPVAVVSKPKTNLPKDPPITEAIVESVSVSTSDIDSCSVSVEQNKETEAQEVAGLLVPPQHVEEVAEEEFGDAEGMYEICRRWMDNFSESKFMIPILMVLLVMPISAGFMGARYMDKCPLSLATPLFLFMLGVLGTLVILCRMFLIAKKMAGTGIGNYETLGTVIIFGNMAILLLLCTQMTSFLRMSPSFEPGTPNYCHRIFYTFTYWLNWTSLFVIVFLTVIHSPKCSRQTSQAEVND